MHIYVNYKRLELQNRASLTRHVVNHSHIKARLSAAKTNGRNLRRQRPSWLWSWL